MYCAIVPARSGSKRIPKKNLLKFEGETLVERAVKCGGATDRVIVATESDEIIELIGGSAEIYLRSQESSTDTANILMLLNEMIDNDVLSSDETVILLQPTSPLRNADHVKAAIELYEQNDGRPVVSGYKADTIPFKFFVANVDDSFRPYSKLFAESAQFLPEYFYPNGALYVFSIKAYEANNYQLPLQSCSLLDMGHEFSLDIDTHNDLQVLKGYGHVEIWAD